MLNANGKSIYYVWLYIYAYVASRSVAKTRTNQQQPKATKAYSLL